MATKEKIPGRGMLLTSFGWIAILLSYFGTFALGLILPYMCEEMGLDSVSLGSSLSSLAFLVKVIVYIPLAMFAARANPKYFLAIVYIMLGGSLILHGLANNVTGLYVGRIMMAAAGSGIMAPLALVKTNWIPKSRLGGLNGIENAVGTVGQYFALSVTVPLIGILGSWRSVLAIFGGIGVIIGVLWIVLFKENEAVGKIVPAQKKPFFQPIGEALKHRSVWLLGIGWPGTTLVWIAITTFWPTYAAEDLGISLEVSGVLLGLIPVGSIIGSLTAPKLADMIGVDKLMLWPWGLILPVMYFLPLVISNVPLIAVCFFIAGYGAYAFVPVAMTHVYKLPGISPAAIGGGISFILTLTSLGGTLAGVLVKALYGSLGLAGALKACCLSPLLWFATTIFLPEYGRKAMAKKAAEEAAQ